MTVCLAYAADEYLLEQGFTITDPGPGQPRTAERAGLVLDLQPRCLCEHCPESEHPRYLRVVEVAR